MAKQCLECNQPMIFIPSGVSKRTGRAYSSFYKCEQCKKTQAAVAGDAPKVQEFAYKLDEETKQKHIDAAMEKKRDGINACVSLEQAILFWQDNPLKSIDGVMEDAEKFLAWLNEKTK